MESPSNLLATQSLSDEMQDDVPSDSDFEHLSAERATRASRPLHSWYGRELLRQHLASENAEKASTSMPAARLDAEASFPYTEVLSKLQQPGLLNSQAYASSLEDDKCTEFITGLGLAALVEANQLGWASSFLAEAIRAPRHPVGDRNSGSHVANIRSLSHLDTRASTFRGEDSDLPGYTMTMNEVVDDQGRKPQYDLRTISQVPPMFEAVLRFGDSTYKGKVSTKQRAKHLASRDACLDNG
ncbi:hypothetical protein LTR95_004274 [Oleoguttula sp. CCFEE 5521]